MLCRENRCKLICNCVYLKKLNVNYRSYREWDAESDIVVLNFRSFKWILVTVSIVTGQLMIFW